MPMRIALALFIVLALMGGAAAQSALPPELQACYAKLGDEVQTELQLRVTIIELQKQIAEMKAKKE